MASSLYFSFANQYSLGEGFLFLIVLVPRYKLSLCHTPIKPDLLGFLGIGVFACGLHDHVITRFTSIFRSVLSGPHLCPHKGSIKVNCSRTIETHET